MIKKRESLLSQNLKTRDLGKKLRLPAGLQNENSKEFVQAKIREKQKKKSKGTPTKVLKQRTKAWDQDTGKEQVTTMQKHQLLRTLPKR